MDLDELKTTWASLEAPLPEVRLPRRRLRKIAFFERCGGVGCAVIALFVVLRFGSLDSAALRLFGVLSIALPVAMAVLSWISIRGFDFQLPYAQALQAFSLAKIRFRRLQKVNIVLALFYITAFTPVSFRIIADKDITQQRSFWLLMLPLYLLLQLIVSWWIFAHRDAQLRKAEQELREYQ